MKVVNGKNGSKILIIKEHSFLIKNIFYNNTNPIWIQCVSTGAKNIIKEYLPDGDWALNAQKFGRDRVFVIYKKSYFNMKTDVKKESFKLCFISLTIEGAKFLAFKHISQKLGYNIDDVAISNISKNAYQWSFEELYTGKQLLASVIVRYRTVDFIDDRIQRLKNGE